MLLGSVEGSVGRVAAMVVTPPYRHGWAAVLLLAASLESAWAAGARRVQFDFLDSNIDMHNVHLKTGTVRILVSFVRPLKDA
jgi:GNAT superfamily N-acetyltransferase